MTCYTWDPDEEACLVHLSADDAASFTEEAGQDQIPHSERPLSVVRLNKGEPWTLSRGSTTTTELGEHAIYAKADRSAFIMFVAERRCGNRDEPL